MFLIHLAVRVVQTNLDPKILATDQGQRAEEILRACVHCGFCNATCPTYQVTGNELDGPRGRIYLIKELLESGEDNPRATTHLDRCLTCRACETTCPSGVAYGELLEIGREVVEQQGRRSIWQRLQRFGLNWLVPHAGRFKLMARLGHVGKWLLPASLRKALPKLIPAAEPAIAQPVAASRKVLLMDGCVQSAVAPTTNVQLRSLLHQRDIETLALPNESCCGAATLHLGRHAAALTHIYALLEQVKPLLDDLDAILSTASGCGVTLKDYARLVPDDSEYKAVAQQFANKVMDAVEYLWMFDDLSATESRVDANGELPTIAWHAPCTLQHGQKIVGSVEALWECAGYTLLPVADPHLCCGSAGTNSVTQPRMAQELRARKLHNLQQHTPDLIATASVGCQTHLMSAAQVPVVHRLELVQ